MRENLSQGSGACRRLCVVDLAALAGGELAPPVSGMAPEHAACPARLKPAAESLFVDRPGVRGPE